MFIKLFIYWLALLPLVVWNGAYEGPKVVWFLSGTIGIILFWIYRVLKEKKNFEIRKADYLFFGWLAILLISSIFGLHPFESIVGGSYRHQGLIFFIGLWLVGKTVGILSYQEKNLLKKSLGYTVLVESIIVLYQIISGHLYFGKPLGTLGETNAVVAFMAIGMYFVYVSQSVFYLILPYAIVLMSGSRSGLLSLSIFSGLFLNKLKIKKILWVLLVLVVLSAAFIISSQKGTSPFESRPVIWNLAIKEISARPVLGFGAETGEIVFDNAFIKIKIPLNGLIIDRAHNLFLDVLMWSGAIGLVLFGSWLYLSFKNINDLARKFAFGAFLIYSMFQPLSIVHWILTIIIINI